MTTPQFDADLAWLFDVAHAAPFTGDRVTFIGTGDTPLAQRTILRNLPDGAIYKHVWLRSDPDDLHDHPWDFCSVILKGGYWEVTPDARAWRAPGSIVFRKAEELHRVELDPAHPRPESLFITARRRRAWGFVTPDGWVDGESYRGFNPGALRKQGGAA